MALGKCLLRKFTKLIKQEFILRVHAIPMTKLNEDREEFYH